VINSTRKRTGRRRAEKEFVVLVDQKLPACLLFLSIGKLVDDTLSEKSDAVVLSSRKGILPYWTVANGISVGRIV